MEPNPLNIEVRTQDEGIRTVRESNVQVTRPPVNVIPLTGLGEQIRVPSVNTFVSENDSETLRGSHVRSQEPGMQENSAIPQVGGPPSIPSSN